MINEIRIENGKSSLIWNIEIYNLGIFLNFQYFF